MGRLPDGVVTFLFTDVEGSTKLWELAPESMMDALRQHDAAIDRAVLASNGVSVKPRGEGDSRFIVFRHATDALRAVAELQRNLAATSWATPRPIRVRAALHTGAADLQMGDYYGSAVNRAARLKATAHGGQTVISASTWELVQDDLPPGVTVIDLGTHRLKDLTRPEHVYQVNVEGLQTSFPALNSLDAVPNNLPEQLTEFIGRDEELEELEGLLVEKRLVTVLAAGGSGKTRLAIQAAANSIDQFRDGVFFVDLAPVGQPDDVVQAVAESLGLSLSTAEDVQAQLLGYLANRRLLLVLDNFEHLLDASPLVSGILRASPQVTVLATSRMKLGVSGETILSLAGFDSTWSDADEAFQSSAIRLFVDAARRAKPSFDLTPQELKAAVSIVRSLEGLPLGIVLAAAWVDLLSIDEIASEISSDIDFLETDLGDVPDRHRSIRAVFDYTWKLLTPDERRIFSDLSVFSGGFTREAAEAVAGASLRNLANLSAKSLLTADVQTRRYAIHELLRQYAEGALREDTDRHSWLQAQHAAFYGDLSVRSFALMRAGDDRTAYASLEDDIDNVRKAWRFSVSTRNPEVVRQMIGPLWMLYEARGWFQAGVMLLDEAIDGFDDHPNTQEGDTRALATAAQGWFLGLLGRQAEAEPATLRAVDTLRTGEDREGLAIALVCRALTLAYTGKNWSEVAREGSSLADSMSDPFWTAVFNNWLGGAALVGGDTRTGRRVLEAGQAIYEELGESYWLSLNFQHQAQTAAVEGRTSDAIQLYRRSTDKAREIGAVRVIQMSAAGLGDALNSVGAASDAEAAYLESLATSERMGMANEMLSLVTKLAVIMSTTGREEKAAELLAAVLGDSASKGTALFDAAPTEERAATALRDLELQLHPEAFATAVSTGRATPYDVVVKEILQSVQ